MEPSVTHHVFYGVKIFKKLEYTYISKYIYLKKAFRNHTLLIIYKIKEVLISNYARDLSTSKLGLEINI